MANPVDAFFHVGASPIAQIFLTIGALESINHNGKLSMNDMHEDSTREVGQFSLPIYGANLLKGKSAAQQEDIKLKELKNGRLAMIGKLNMNVMNVVDLSLHILTSLHIFFVAIGGLVHHTLIAGTETFGPFPNPHLWSL